MQFSNIENQITISKAKRKEVNKSENIVQLSVSYGYGEDDPYLILYETGINLHEKTNKDILFLKSLVGANDIKYKMVADQLADEILQCGIDYFNQCLDSDLSHNFTEKAQKLASIADLIAKGDLIKERVKDTLSTFDEMKDVEINRAITILNTIKTAYDEAITNINKQVLETIKNLPLIKS